MPASDKRVFISYRRSTSSAHARQIFDRLRTAGFEAFLDTDTTDVGPFDPMTFSQIGACPHYVLLAMPKTFGNCPNKRDWLRIELEEAVRRDRNGIVLADADLDLYSEMSYIPDHLRKTVQSYSGLPFLPAYFQATLDRLIAYLEQPLTRKIDIIAPAPDEQQRARQRIEQIAVSPAPTPDQIMAEQLYCRAQKNFDGDTSTEDLIADYTEAVRLNPQFAAAYYQRGILRAHHMSDRQGAIADYTEAIRLNPDHSDAYYDRARVYRSQQEPESAIADYEEAIRGMPGDPDVFNELDDLYAAKGDIEARIRLYTRWMEFDPDLAIHLYNQRGNLYLNKGDLESAIADFGEAIRVAPQVAPAYSNRGEAYFAKGWYTQALNDFTQAFEQDSQYSFSVAGLAITYHALGQVAEAEKYWKNLLLLNPWITDVESAKRELNWAEPLAEEASKLVAKL